jgi:hypothetical protein
MSIIHLTIGIGTVLILAGSLSRADAAQIPLKGTFSGTFVNSQIDTNNDGRKASLGTRGMKGTFGPATGQAMLEYASPSPGTCPNGNAGVILTLVPGTGHDVARLTSTGDLIIGEYTAGALCVDTSTGIQFFTLTEQVTGGTGRFAEAKGSITITGTSMRLFADAAGNFFGTSSGTYEGTLILPKGENETRGGD